MKKAKKKFIFEFDNMQMTLFLAGLLTICLLAFAIGVKVGVKKGGDEFREAALKKDLRHKIKAPSLLKADKGAGSDRVEQKKVASIETVIAASNEETKTSAGKANKKETPNKKVVKAPAPAVEKKAEVKKKSDKKGTYFVQVASFRSAGDAKERAGELSKKGYKAVIVKAEIPGKGTYHRVRLGPFEGLKEAKAFAAVFEKKEKVSTYIPLD